MNQHIIDYLSYLFCSGKTTHKQDKEILKKQEEEIALQIDYIYSQDRDSHWMS